jgi:hypothetical protein
MSQGISETPLFDENMDFSWRWLFGINTTRQARYIPTGEPAACKCTFERKAFQVIGAGLKRSETPGFLVLAPCPRGIDAVVGSNHCSTR